MQDYITVIGGGLAGCEAAYQIAKAGIKVKLYEMKPTKFSEAHSNKDLAEIVCSNSFKSNLLTNACGVLKEELRKKDSLLIKIKQISKLTGEDKLYFYDAAAPIIEKDSINFDIAFYGNRYEQEKKKDETIEEWKTRQEKQEKSYINLPMNQEEYKKFWNELVEAEVVTLHDFEKREIFEGCMPIEIMAKRGIDTLRFGPLKPVGFDDPRFAKRPYGVVQLRQDNMEGNLYNMVGFQTNLKFGEQKKVFSLIPGLENAEFVKYGVMDRNTYINSTKLLDNTYNLKSNNNIFFAGQITGVEGYVESISSGMVASLNAIQRFKGKEKIVFPNYTVIGALAKYISTENDKFQPMNANFGILPELEGKRIRDKKERYTKLAERSLEYFE